MKCKNVYEFLLWDNCNNRCKFCFQRDNPRLFTLEQRQQILNKTIEFIDSDTFIKGSHILVVGGEIFDKPTDYNILDSFFNQIVNRMKNDIIDLLYINTNLIYNDTTSLINFLDIILRNGLFNRLRFTTSYDLEGRFRTEEDRLTMLNNLKMIKDKYNDLQIVVNTILTKKVCKDIISKEFNIKDFMEEYKCWVCLIPYIIYIPELSANKSDVFKALKTTDEILGGHYLPRYIKNLDLNQDKLLYMYKDNKYTFCSCINSECGHPINFKRYSESGTCFICDLKSLFQGLYE